MRFDARHLSMLRSQGVLAARAAMTRSRQAGLGMALALIAAGQFSGLHGASKLSGDEGRINPGPVDYARAIDEGLSFPAASLQKDAAMALARREAASLMSGFAGTVTVSVSKAIAETEIVAETHSLDASLPQSIVQGGDRIERPVLRSKAGEVISATTALAALLQDEVTPAPTHSYALAEAALAEPESEIKVAMLRIAQDAHSRNGRPAMSAQAMGEYLSLYAMRERVADVGRALALGTPEQASGFWVANLGDGMDDALFQNGLAFGQDSLGVIAGANGVVQNLLSDGDKLVYGGFAGAFGAGHNDVEPPSTIRNMVRGGTIGLFAVLDDGPFSVAATLRSDYSESLDEFAPHRLDVSSAMQVLKAEVVARYRFDVSDWTIEPSAGVSFATGRREISGIALSAPQVDTAESLKFQLGVKATGVVYNRAGTSVEPSVTITIAEDLRDSGNVAFLGGAPNASAEPVRGKTVGSVSIGVDVKDDSGWVGFVRADGQVSDEDKPSAGVSAGVKTQW